MFGGLCFTCRNCGNIYPLDGGTKNLAGDNACKTCLPLVEFEWSIEDLGGKKPALGRCTQKEHAEARLPEGYALVQRIVGGAKFDVYGKPCSD